MDYFAVVPNAPPSRMLPKEFSVLGSCETPVILREGRARNLQNVLIAIWWFLIVTPFKWPNFDHHFRHLDRVLEGAEGSAYIEFGINQPLYDQLGRYLLNYCSRDGRKQCKLWQSLNGKFRLDVVGPAFGRRTHSADLDHLKVGVLHKIAVSWSKAGLTAALDGSHIFIPIEGAS